jgi:hypothetical protein
MPERLQRTARDISAFGDVMHGNADLMSTYHWSAMANFEQPLVLLKAPR